MEETPLELVPSVTLKARAELLAMGIKTLEQARELTDEQLLQAPSVGRVAINAIRLATPPGDA